MRTAISADNVGAAVRLHSSRWDSGDAWGDTNNLSARYAQRVMSGWQRLAWNDSHYVACRERTEDLWLSGISRRTRPYGPGMDDRGCRYRLRVKIGPLPLQGITFAVF